MMIHFKVYGKIIAKQGDRSHIGKSKSGKSFVMHYQPKAIKDWQQRIRSALLETKPVMLSGPLSLRIDCFFLLPKTKRKKDKSKQPTIKDTKPDWENIGKGICDACEKIAYSNDSQIADARVVKYYTELGEWCEVTIEELKGQPSQEIP